jgi:hypothetical protein
MSESRDKRLESLQAAWSRLPRDIDPPRDLWPAIEARLRKPSRLAAAATGLPERIEPPKDLWPAIEARLGEPSARAVAGAWGARYGDFSIAAGLAAITLMAGLAAYLARHVEPAVDRRFGDSWSLAEEAYAPAGLAYPVMAAALAEARPVIERDIATVRSQRAAIEAAMRVDPNNPRLRELWLYAYETELSLLNEVGRVLNDYQRG